MPQLMLFSTIVLLTTTAHTYIWPSPQLDALESLRFGTDRHQIAPFVQPCTFFIFEVAGKSGRSNAADWIRTAYHDMATHNNVDGTGGMDASIRFPEKQARGENVADGFNNTLRIVGRSQPIRLPYVLPLEVSPSINANWDHSCRRPRGGNSAQLKVKSILSLRFNIFNKEWAVVDSQREI